MSASDTIVALATSAGKAALAVVRVSGPQTRAVLAGLGVKPGAPRRVKRVSFRDGAGEVFDHGLLLWFSGPRSFTGEDVAELHLHGGRAIVEAAISTAIAAGARLAEPGEFTRRAFENGKLGLDQAEAIADLIDASLRQQAKQAIRQLDGELGARYRGWRERLISPLAELEALVDFPDEGTVGDRSQALREIGRLQEELRAAAVEGSRGRSVREGYRVAIVGPPNAGKSTLFNGLVGRDAAIIADQPGTTRDVIEAVVEIGGYPVLLADTAGLRDTKDVVEGEGVRRARAWADAADRRLWVFEGQGENDGPWGDPDADWRAGDLLVVNKSDRGRELGLDLMAKAETLGLAVARASARSGDVGAVSRWLAKTVQADLSGAEFPAVTRRRHLECLTEAMACLEAVQRDWGSPELAAESMRRAAKALALIVGAVHTEDVLDRVFATFCIGK